MNKSTITLFRAVSHAEKENYDRFKQFRTGKNTLEAKQFFKSKAAIQQFVTKSVEQNYVPPYIFLFIIFIDEVSFKSSKPEELKLDGFDAITIQEEQLEQFNNSVNFVKIEEL